MKIGFVIFEGMTALDFVGVYDPITRLKTMGFVPDLKWELCSFTEDAGDNTGLVFHPTQPAGTSLAHFDLVIIPGGFGTRGLVNDVEFIKWIGTCADVPLKATVCTGSLLLGAAGLLKGKKATTHRSAQAELSSYVSEVLDERIVDQGDLITARGVTSAIDLGLYLCGRLTNEETREIIRKQMDYLG